MNRNLENSWAIWKKELNFVFQKFSNTRNYAEIQNFDPCPLEAEEFGVEE